MLHVNVQRYIYTTELHVESNSDLIIDIFQILETNLFNSVENNKYCMKILKFKHLLKQRYRSNLI